MTLRLSANFAMLVPSVSRGVRYVAINEESPRGASVSSANTCGRSTTSNILKPHEQCGSFILSPALSVSNLMAKDKLKFHLLALTCVKLVTSHKNGRSFFSLK